jgi:hypothetical protein
MAQGLHSYATGLAWRDLAAEESHQSIALVKDGAESYTGRVALHNECTIECQQLQHRRTCQCEL